MDCGQVDKYSSGVPFTGQVAEIALPEQKIQQMIDALNSIYQAIVSIIEHCTDLIKQIWNAILKSYPDQRVVCLAFHHKKERVRKKNRNRILKYMKKVLNYES